MATTKLTRQCIRSGAAQADKLLAANQQAQARRTAALRRATRAARQKALAAGAGPVATLKSTGWLIAEGDSWFDYPLCDVLKILEDDHGYDVESVARKGDAVEGMAYDEGQLSDFVRRLARMLRNNQAPKAILLSGGGNDIAGEQFEIMLNHANSPIAGFSEAIVQSVIDERIRGAYITIISTVTRVCDEMVRRRIPVLVHGYDYAVPDGRGFLGGWGPLPGPWLEPGFRRKGFTGNTAQERSQRIEMLKTVMDKFNAMLADVTALAPFAHVRHVDLRNTLSSGADYKKWWGNELHPTERGFKRVAERFQQTLASL